jgi:hypothetical protein
MLAVETNIIFEIKKVLAIAAGIKLHVRNVIKLRILNKEQGMEYRTRNKEY